MGEAFKLRGSELWQARKRLRVNRGVVARMLGLHDKTYGAIERKNLSIPPEALEKAHLVVRLADGINGDRWEPKDREAKIDLPFPRPDCPTCRTPLTTKSVNQSRTRGKVFYFRCKQCERRFWSNTGELHRANEGRGNWKDVAGRPKCPACDVLCWIEGRSSSRHGKRFWRCPKCKKLYARIRGKIEAANFPVHRRSIRFLKNRVCPKCGAERLRLRSRPPNSPHWYFVCPDCNGRFRWNKKLKRLVVAKGASRKRHPGRKPGMTKERAKEAARIEELVQQNGGRRGALKKAVEKFRAESYPNLDFHTVYERVQKMRHDCKSAKKTGNK